MMPLVGLDIVWDELEDAKSMDLMRVLVRKNLFHGADNTPHLLILTDKAMYWGGTKGTGNAFNRIPLKSVLESRIRGFSIWQTIELIHMEIGGEEKIFVTPYTGDCESPEKDPDAMRMIVDRCKGWIR